MGERFSNSERDDVFYVLLSKQYICQWDQILYMQMWHGDNASFKIFNLKYWTSLKDT